VQGSEQAHPESAAPAQGASAIPPAVELRSVSVYFGDNPVLLDVSLNVDAGGTLMLLGPTASGKSVLLKTALGLLKPVSGQVLVDGIDLVPLQEKEIVPIRRKMGFVFQEGALFAFSLRKRRLSLARRTPR
jgi:phospholipid/cholesterol/gamma-HCH transport system ATP-binding protein